MSTTRHPSAGVTLSSANDVEFGHSLQPRGDPTLACTLVPTGIDHLERSHNRGKLDGLNLLGTAGPHGSTRGVATRWVLEEGFATYVSRRQTGLDYYEVNRWAPQDSWKIDMAERIEQAGPTKAMVDGVRSLEDLFAFGREIGVIT